MNKVVSLECSLEEVKALLILPSLCPWLTLKMISVAAVFPIKLFWAKSDHCSHKMSSGATERIKLFMGQQQSSKREVLVLRYAIDEKDLEKMTIVLSNPSDRITNFFWNQDGQVFQLEGAFTGMPKVWVTRSFVSQTW